MPKKTRRFSKWGFPRSISLDAFTLHFAVYILTSMCLKIETYALLISPLCSDSNNVMNKGVELELEVKPRYHETTAITAVQSAGQVIYLPLLREKPICGDSC